MTLTFSGLLLGFVASLGATRLLSTLLFGVSARDPLTMAAAVCVLTFIAFFACYIPARRATHVDPLIALRSE